MSSNNITNSSVVLVTGATAGIGRALAIAIAELPHKPRVVGVGRREGRLKELESKGLETIQLDVGRATRNDWEQVLEKYPNVSGFMLPPMS
jgi:NADP-dependent 3-hydroxy acid dehydrogenase YdfG